VSAVALHLRGFGAIQRAGTTVAWATVVALIARSIWLSAHKSYSIDEFQYTHAAWLVAKGSVPYRDFFDVHFPLVYLWLSPLVKVFGATPESIRWMRGAMLPFLALSCVGLWLATRRRGSIAAAAAIISFLGTSVVALHSVEIRADGMGTAFLVASLGVLSSNLTPARKGFVAGVLVGLACAASQKTAIVASPFAAGFALDLWWNRRTKQPLLLGSPGAFGLGLTLVGTLAIGYLVSTGATKEFFRWTILWASERERLYPGFSFREHTLPSLVSAAPLLALAALGIGLMIRRLGSSARDWSSDPDLILLLTLPAAAAISTQVAPYPYSLLPLFAVAALCVGAVFDPRRGSPGFTIFGAVGLAALILLSIGPVASSTSNSYQQQVLAQVGALTRESDCVYDNSGSATARPHASYFYATDALLRWQLQQMLVEEMAGSIRDARCIAMIRDLRFDGLPAKLQQFLREHFQPYSADLWLYGRRYRLATASTAPFDAPVKGEYFVYPPTAVGAGGLEIDGASVTSSTFELDRGVHQIRVDGHPVDFYLLWLPRNGELWHPVPEAPPRFSVLL
jgi:hypothetical protein